MVNGVPQGTHTVHEYWAIRMPQAHVSHSLPGAALGTSFWFRSARGHVVCEFIPTCPSAVKKHEKCTESGARMILLFHVSLFGKDIMRF